MIESPYGERKEQVWPNSDRNHVIKGMYSYQKETPHLGPSYKTTRESFALNSM